MNDCHVSIQSSGKENESADIFIMYIHVVAIALGAKSSYFSQTAENSHLLYTASAENELHDPVAYSIPVDIIVHKISHSRTKRPCVLAHETSLAKSRTLTLTF